MKRRILSMLLVLMMLLTIMPTVAFAEETADGVTYSYADGILTVSGTGTCTDGWSNELPGDTWMNITGLIIEDGITGIARAAFSGLPNLKNVTIPDSVTEIGPFAFQHCTSLESMNWPSQVTRIEDGVLASCSGLKSITIPETVTYIGNGAFSYCTSLTELYIPASVTEISYSPCANCTSLKAITVPEENEVFFDENGVLFKKEIEGEDVDIELYQCPAGYESTEYTISDNVEIIRNEAFAGCVNIEKINIGKNILMICQWAFDDCKRLSQITVAEGNKYFKLQNNALFWAGYTVSDDGQSEKNELYRLVKCVPTYEGEFAIPDGVKKLDDSAFADCLKLTGVTIPGSLETIGQMAFENCDGLTDITIPGSVREIRNFAFHSCDSLKSIIIPEGVTTIGSGAFDSCKKLESVVLPSTLTEIDNNLFVACDSLKNVTLSEGITSISGGMFSSCTSLKNITIPSSVTSIGGYAFSSCISLENAIMPNGVTTIEDCTFFNCSSLKDVTIPASVTEINEMAFLGDDLDNVYFGGNSEQWKAIVGDYDVLKNFAKIVHYNYVAGQDHTVTNGVCSCGAYSAEHTHVYGDDNRCKYCGEKNPDAHEHDFLHGTVGKDDNGTYITCKDCTARSYATVETGKCGDNVTYTWTKFDVPGYDTLVVSGEGDMLDWGEVSPWWRGKLTTVIVEEGITRVGNMAIADRFDGDDLLTTVQLPSTLKSIGSYAFSYNENLKSIKLPNGLETIEVGAFQACNSLTSVTIPASVKSIQFAAFSALPSDKLRKAYSLTQYNVAADNAYYKSVDGALYSKDGSTLVNYPAARTNTKITVPDGTAKLSDWSFSINANVETIVLPASIEDIQMGAFYGCNSLETILFNGTREAWDAACGDKDNIAAQEINVVCLGDETGKTVSDNKTAPTVTVKGYDNTIDTVDTVTITEATDEDAKSIIEGSDIVLISGDGVKAYNITLKDDKGEEVQPGGYVQVKLKVPAGYEGGKCVVYHQNENGTLTPVDAVFDGEYLVFITGSFSNYIIHQPHEHDFGEAVIVKEANCIEPGYTEKTCSVCNEKVKTEIPATGHNAPLTGDKAATCTEDGSTGKRICTKCEAILQIAQVVEAPGHNYVNGKCTVCGATNPDYKPPRPVHVHRYTETVTEPTCTEKGYTTYTCSCGYSYVDDYVNAKGHTEVVDPAVAATCEKTGLTEGKHCSVCNEVLVAQKETPKTEHKFENGKCSVCGAADPNYVAPVVNPFKDVKKGDPFYDEIFWAYGNSIINGDGTGNYNPNDGITRAQIVMILWNAAGNKEASKPSGFADVKDGAWYAKAVAWAVENGITNGTDLGFEPDRVCTRAEIVTFLHRANNKPAPAAAASFTDLTQDWYKDAVAWAVENGITKGVGGNRFAPNDTCTRGQAAAFMYRLAQLAK